jgi:DNA-binding winged helix-turn-helix (wHTH) protein
MTDADSREGAQYRFAQFVLDLEQASLRKAGHEVKLRPKVYDALRYLLENRGRLIAKEELIHALWPDSFVTEDSLVQCMVELRRALGDQEQAILKTVPRRGYLFAAAVQSEGGAQAGIARGPDGEQPRSELPAARAEASRQRLAGRSPLPLPRTPLIGRERELPAVTQLLLDPTGRWVT